MNRYCILILSLVACTAQSELAIEHKGVFIKECSLSEEGRDKMLHPSHPFCAQLSADRFLWIYQTREK